MAESGPNQKPAEDRLSTSASRDEMPAKTRYQILVVEDNKADVYLIRKAIELAEIDADLHFAHDGQAATEYLDAVDSSLKACPDLVLLDLNLPKKNGDEVLRHLRGVETCKHARVLVVTSSNSPRDRQSVATLLVAGYFRKPSEYDEFMLLGPVVKSLLDPPNPLLSQERQQAPSQ